MSQLNVDVITGRDGQKAPEFTKGAVVTGVVTATSFTGNLTGDASGSSGSCTGNSATATLATNAQGLTGTPAIIVGDITAAAATFSGNVSIAKTLTYEDVKNIDSVGIVTAREGVFIPDSKELKIGNTAASPDLKLYHDGSNSYIMDSGTGGLRLCADEFNVKNAANNEVIIRGTQDAGVELNFNAATKIVTTNTGAIVTGILTATTFVGRLETVPTTNKTASATAAKADAGTMITTNSQFIIPQNIFAAGDIISIYNNSASDIQISQGTGVTLRLVGGTTTGNRTLAQRGLATVTCVAANEFVCSGGGLT